VSVRAAISTNALQLSASGGPALNVAAGGSIAVGAGGINLSGFAPTIDLASDATSPGTILLDGPVTVAAGGAANITSSGAALLPGTLNLNGRTQTFAVSSTLLIGARLTNGGMTKSGAGTLFLGADNQYLGATNVTAGTLRLGADNAIPGTSALTLSGGSIVDI